MKRFYLVLILFIGLTIFLPFLLTRQTFVGIGFSNTGEIGDTIGGLTAPAIGILSIYLLYKTLMAQIKSNDVNQILAHYNHINQNIELLKFRSVNLGKATEYSGSEAILRALDQESIIKEYIIDYPFANHVFSELSLISSQYKILILLIEGSQLSESEQKNYLLFCISLYKTKLEYVVNKTIMKCIGLEVDNILFRSISSFQERMSKIDGDLNNTKPLSVEAFLELYRKLNDQV